MTGKWTVGTYNQTTTLLRTHLSYVCCDRVGAFVDVLTISTRFSSLAVFIGVGVGPVGGATLGGRFCSGWWCESSRVSYLDSLCQNQACTKSRCRYCPMGPDGVVTFVPKLFAFKEGYMPRLELLWFLYDYRFGVFQIVILCLS